MLRDRLIFLVSTLQLYSQGGMVNVLTSLPIFTKISNHHSSLTVRSIWVSNPISYPHLRFSASIISRKKLSPLVFPLVYVNISPTLSIIWYIFYMILAFMFKILNIFVIKQPTNPLRLIRTTNVCVSGLTESSGTSFGRH